MIKCLKYITFHWKTHRITSREFKQNVELQFLIRDVTCVVVLPHILGMRVTKPSDRKTFLSGSLRGDFSLSICHSNIFSGAKFQFRKHGPIHI